MEDRYVGGESERQPSESRGVADQAERAHEDLDADAADTHAAEGSELDSVALRIRERLFGSRPPMLHDDRFRIERMLGSGGMGTVYEAWDAKLQRRVALKFLRGGQRGVMRFHREAQGLARISHPNVISVYDVGRWDERVWIVMEFVPGQTLGEWAATPRAQAEVLDTWIAAGRGLAAIHDAGMIHRDIKPQNVLLGNDGRVRVIDLGLVKAHDTIDEPRDASVSDDSELDESSGALRSILTDAGSFIGTPGYAAPEHLQHRHADARSDQFSFCVAVWECLCGTRPPSERRRGGLVPLPEHVRMPKHVHVALSRGLSLDALDRFADMHALLDALTPKQRRWLPPTMAASSTAVLATGIGWVLGGQPKADDPCAHTDTAIVEVWSERRREQLRRELGPVMLGQVDAWVAGWTQSAKTSCEDAHVRQLYSQQTSDRRSRCLTHSLEGFEGFVLALDEGRVRTGTDVIEWFARLESPELCLSEASSRRESSEPAPEHAQELSRLRRRLTAVGAADERSYRAQIEDVLGIRERAAVLNDAGLRGAASLTLGLLYIKVHDVDAARTELGHAIDVATALSDVHLGGRAWAGMFEIESELVVDRKRAAWALDRHAALFETVDPGPRARAELLHQRVEYLIMESRLVEAEATLHEVLALYEAAGVSGTWEQARALRARAWLLLQFGRNDEALADIERARVLELGGPPSAINPQGFARFAKDDALLEDVVVLHEAGEFVRAKELAVEGLALAIEQQGPRGELVVRMHQMLGAACLGLDDLDCAREHFEQADAIATESLGPTHPLRMEIIGGLGVWAYRAGELERSAAHFEHALALARTNFAADSIDVAGAELNLASALREIGSLERARQLTESAARSLAARLPSEHPERVRASLMLSELDVARGG